MKILLIIAIVFGGYWIWDLSKTNRAAAELSEQTMQREQDTAKARRDRINGGVTFACREAVTRKLAGLGGDRRVLDWHPGLKDDHTFSETTSGYKIRQTAKVSGHESTFNADCYTSKDFALLDASFGWWVGSALVPIP